MAQIKLRDNTQLISKSRAAKALLLTILTILGFCQLIYHVYWAFSSIFDHRFGGALNSAAVVGGSLVLNVFLTIRVLLFCETRLLSDQIDADHKKYL